MSATETDPLPSPLSTGIIRFSQEGAKGPDTHWKLQTNLAPVNPLQACLITQRLCPLVGKVIRKQQKEYMPGNVIGSCIINILNLMKHVKRKTIESLILLTDFLEIILDKKICYGQARRPLG